MFGQMAKWVAQIDRGDQAAGRRRDAGQGVRGRLGPPLDGSVLVLHRGAGREHEHEDSEKEHGEGHHPGPEERQAQA